jgi:plasmid stability protein
VESENREIVKNALRLVEKARPMSPLMAAEYLTPLRFLDVRSQGPEAAGAIAAISALIESLRAENQRAENKTAPDFWIRTLAALQIWRDTFAD